MALAGRPATRSPMPLRRITPVARQRSSWHPGRGLLSKSCASTCPVVRKWLVEGDEEEGVAIVEDVWVTVGAVGAVKGVVTGGNVVACAIGGNDVAVRGLAGDGSSLLFPVLVARGGL